MDNKPRIFLKNYYFLNDHTGQMVLNPQIIATPEIASVLIFKRKPY